MSAKATAKPKAAKSKAKTEKEEPKAKKAKGPATPVKELDTTPALDLSALAPRPGARKVRKRLGIGEGSGNGKTCGKGQKGQTSRSGFGLPAGFEGGQMPIFRRLPKVGFTSRKKTLGVNDFQVIGLDAIVRLIEAGTKGEPTLETMKTAGLARAKRRVKILGGAELKQKIVIEAHAVSASARAAIEGAGGEVRIVQ